MLGKVVLKVEGVNVAKTLENLKNQFEITNIFRVHSTQTILTAKANSCAKLIDYLKQKCYNVNVLKFSVLLRLNIFFRKFWPQTLIFILTFLVLCTAQNFVFDVDFKQDNNEINTKINQTLSDMHIFGKAKNNINKQEIETEILKNVLDVSLVDVSFCGCYLIVNYTTKTFEHENMQKHEGPIVAKSDGVVSKIFVASGTLMVSVGSYVREGQTLIADYFIDKDGNTVFCEAKGEVFVDKWESVVVEFCEDTIEYAETGREIAQTIVCPLGKEAEPKQIEIPFEHFEKRIEKQKLTTFGVPVDVVFVRFVETTPLRVHTSFAEKEESLKLQAKEEFLNQFSQFEILEEKYTISTASNVYFVTYYAKTEKPVT